MMRSKYKELRGLRTLWLLYRSVAMLDMPIFQKSYWHEIVYACARNRFSLSEMLWASGALITYAR